MPASLSEIGIRVERHGMERTRDVVEGGEVDGVECVEMGEHRREETGG